MRGRQFFVVVVGIGKGGVGGGGSAQEQAYRLGMGVTTRGFAWARPGRGGRVGMGVAE